MNAPMAFDRTTLEEAGLALYGASWQSELARALDIADRTVRRWAAGDTTIPDGVWGEIAALAKARGRALEKLAARLSR